ncbi:MAG: histidine kinase [Candidatus Promineifilaceae bacterium]
MPDSRGQREVGGHARSLPELTTAPGEGGEQLAATNQELRQTADGLAWSEHNTPEIDKSLETIIQTLPLAILLLGPAGAVRAWNPAAQKLLGWDAEAPSMPSETIRKLREQPGFGELLRQAVEEERIITGAEIELSRPDGQPLFASVALAPLHDDLGKSIGAVTVLTDITGQVVARRQLEQRLTDRTRKLSVLNDLLLVTSTADDMATILSRSLRRIIAATQREMGYIHLLDSRGYLHLASHQELPPAIAESLAELSLEADERADCWVATQRTFLTVPRIRDDDRTVHLASLPSRLNTYTGVPLLAGNKVVGVLSMIGESPAQFTDEERDLLLTIGRQLGAAVETARLRHQESNLMVLQERNRLARDLHDSVTQSLYSVMLFAEASRRKLEAGQEGQAASYLTRVTETSQQALREMRLLIHKLRPAVLQEEGLARALQQRLKAVEGRSGIEHELFVEGDLALSPRLEEALYHVSQEALNNSLKHARASKVIVRLCRDEGQVVLEVSDNGRGFDPEKAASSTGIGLKSMHERIEACGGSVNLQSTLGAGTTVDVRVPL